MTKPNCISASKSVERFLMIEKSDQMEENPSRISCKKGTHKAAGPTRKCSGSGKHCRSCAAVMIADCVALCCCPCALVNLLALAFVKLPWMVGRKCLGLGKKKGKNLEMKAKKRKEEEEERGGGDGNMRDGGVEIGILEDDIVGFEAERVWMELYRVGHLGFGRVSFTGVQTQ